MNWVDKSSATSEKLAFINGGGNAILKVDNTTNVVWQNKRDSVIMLRYLSAGETLTFVGYRSVLRLEKCTLLAQSGSRILYTCHSDAL